MLTTPDGVQLDAALHKPTGTVLGNVLQVHGITVDLDEGGIFRRLGDQLANSGFLALRFSFRGHGRSGGLQEGITIGGEIVDTLTAFRQLNSLNAGPTGLVAASFGAVSTSLILKRLLPRPFGLVYWNPVLDLTDTFLEPSLPWGLKNFGSRIAPALAGRGYVTVDGAFRLGPAIFEEMAQHDVRRAFCADRTPALVIHGDRDAAVSYSVARDASRERSSTEFATIQGSGHGFDGREREDAAISRTVAWLMAQVPNPAG